MQHLNILPDFFEDSSVGEAEYTHNDYSSTNSILDETKQTTAMPGISLLAACPLSVSSKSFMPKLVKRSSTYTLLGSMHSQIIPFCTELVSKQWRFYVVAQNRGYCKYSERVITVPLWTFRESQAFRDWYLAHEISHAFTDAKVMHGPEFMEHLKMICPAHAIHFETTYKPRIAKACGISDNRAMNNLMLAGVIPADF